MKTIYAICTIEYAYPEEKDDPYLSHIYAGKIYDYTTDLESAIFVGLHLLSDLVHRVHVKEVLGDVKAIIKRDGDITSPEVFVRI